MFERNRLFLLLIVVALGCLTAAPLFAQPEEEEEPVQARPAPERTYAGFGTIGMKQIKALQAGKAVELKVVRPAQLEAYGLKGIKAGQMLSATLKAGKLMVQDPVMKKGKVANLVAMESLSQARATGRAVSWDPAGAARSNLRTGHPSAGMTAAGANPTLLAPKAGLQKKR